MGKLLFSIWQNSLFNSIGFYLYKEKKIASDTKSFQRTRYSCPPASSIAGKVPIVDKHYNKVIAERRGFEIQQMWV